MDRFKGNELISRSDLLSNTSGMNYQYSVFQQGVDNLISRLIELQDKLFFVKEHNEKEEIKDRIQEIYNQIILEQIGQDSELREDYIKSLREPSAPFILWQLYFPKVFKENGGFDIVIGNPPYVQLQKSISDTEKLGDMYEKLGFETFAKTGDLYCLFYEKGYTLLKEKGILSFITSNKWMRAGYGEKLRGFFANKTNPIKLIDFGGQKIFESATVDVNVLMFVKGTNRHQTMACTITEDCTNNLSVYIEQTSSILSFDTSNSWSIQSPIEQSIKSKIEQLGTPLKEWNLSINRGILTGYNEAFIITSDKKDELIAADPKSAEIIRPILRGRDIKRYEYNFADLWLIATFPSRHYNIDDYPAIKEHLLSFGIERLEQTGKKYNINGIEVKARKKTSNKWFETQDSISYWNEFFKQKIVYREISDAMDACIVGSDFMLNNKCYLITGEHLIYILTYLNSKLFTKIMLQQANVTGGKGEAFLNAISLIQPTDDIEAKIIQIYNQLDTNFAASNDMLDSIFCDLYGLTVEEKQYILDA